MLMLPLEVLPGWPAPDPVSSLFLILLMVIAPIAGVATIWALFFGRKFARGTQDNGGLDPVEGDAFGQSE